MSDDRMRRLPEKCWAMLDGEAHVIRRGGEATPIRTGALGVMIQNQQLGVTDAQRMAMIAGVTFGWDSPGADPGPMPKHIMRVEIPVTATVEVEAYTVDDAIEQAHKNIQMPNGFRADGTASVTQIERTTYGDVH